MGCVPPRTTSPVVQLGATGGASQIQGLDGPTVLEASTTAQRKRADLMVGRYAELFGTR